MERKVGGGRRRPARTQLRALIGIALITVWSFVVVSGVVLWLAPSGPRSGRRELLLGLARSPSRWPMSQGTGKWTGR